MKHQSIATLPTSYGRDASTWMLYSLIGYYAFMVNLLGPATPFLQRELGLSYTQTSLHSSGLALGLVATGLVGARLVAHWGRRRLLWLGGGGLAGAGTALAASQHLAASVPSAFAMGLFGSLLLVVCQALLAAHHPKHSAQALMEANVGASVCTTAAPLLIGLCASTLLGWRGAVLVGAALFGVLALAFGHVAHHKDETVHSQEAHPRQALPLIYWGYWVVLVLAGSIEYAIVFWASGFLVARHSWAPAEAATALTLFFALMAVGRLGGALLLGRANAQSMLRGALVATFIGALLFWASPSSIGALLGLAVVGLGVANLYPLILAQALSVAATQGDAASARASLGTGVATLVAPFALGVLADGLGLDRAFAVVPVLALLAGSVLAFVQHKQRAA